jgi:uncharacterized membrane protein (UPF0127 family)
VAPDITAERFLAAGVAAGALVANVAFAQMPTMELSAGIHLIRAEVAHTFETRAQGLMFRRSLGPNEGMFFVFPQAEIHCMWMKNTLIPLSVAFIDEKGRIVSISEMQPQTETPHCAVDRAQFALEMSAGWFAAKGIKAGARILGLEKAPAAR